jgi:large repetitive protein
VSRRTGVAVVCLSAAGAYALARAHVRLAKSVTAVALAALIVTPAAIALGFTDDSFDIPPAYVGQPYSKQFNGRGGCGPALPYQYTIIGGALPPGLSLSLSGLISGTPTQPGSYSFWVNLGDQNPPSASWCRPANSQREFTINVSSTGPPPPKPPPSVQPPPPPPLTITSSSVPRGEVDLAYATSFTATGGPPSSGKTWSVSGGVLPPGLTLSADGHVAGAPTAPGGYDFTVTVRAGTRSASKPFRIDVIPGITVNATPVVPTAEVRTPYTASVATILGLTGGAPPYRFVPMSGFPFGIGFDPTAGTIFGLPRQAGTLSLTISIIDANKAAKQVTLQLVVIPRVHIVPIDLHRGYVRRAYHATVTVTGGQDPAWSTSAGVLPPGLRLDGATGVISGVPTRRGVYPFVVSVHDALGATVAIRYTLNILRAPRSRSGRPPHRRYPASAPRPRRLAV